MKNLSRCCIAFLLLVFSSACSVHMAATQPSRKNVDLFRPGTPRAQLLAEFGNPVAGEEKDGKRMDIFRFRQGYSGGAKAVRAVTHGVMDVLTIGLWEVVGTPVEGVADGEDVAYQVTYDTNDCVAQALPLTTGDGGRGGSPGGPSPHASGDSLDRGR